MSDVSLPLTLPWSKLQITQTRLYAYMFELIRHHITLTLHLFNFIYIKFQYLENPTTLMSQTGNNLHFIIHSTTIACMGKELLHICIFPLCRWIHLYVKMFHWTLDNIQTLQNEVISQYNLNRPLRNKSSFQKDDIYSEHKVSNKVLTENQMCSHPRNTVLWR